MSGQLSKRKKQMIDVLLKENDFISTTVISNALKVSRRTVLREIGDVEKWLSENGFTLSRITGKGIRLEVTKDKRLELKQLIENEKVLISYTPFERQRKLLLELLNATEPKKIYYFSAMLKVSEATISYDLDKIEEWLTSWHLELVRKPGYGIIVEGRESNFRKAIIFLFNEYFDRGDLLYLIRDEFIDGTNLLKKASIKKTLLDVIGYTMLESIEEIVKEAGVLEEYPFADSAYAALIIHMSLSIKRLSEGGSIHFDRQKLEAIEDSKEYELASKIVDLTSESFGLNIPDDEIGYIAMHIKGSRLRPGRKGQTEIKVHDYEVIYLIELLIKEMESLTGYQLVEDQHLLTGLINHFGPALSRIKQGVEIRNPLMNEMKNRYKTYYDYVSKAVKSIENHINISIPDDEVAYLTMHFTASVESIKKVVASPWKVAIVCSTGIGSSKLLEARVKKQYKNMTVVSVISSSEIGDYKNKGIDLFISTIAIKTSKVPYVVVSPLLLEEDMRRIEQILTTMVPLRQTTDDKEAVGFIDLLTELSYITEASQQLLNHFFIIKSKDNTIEAIMASATRYISMDQAERLSLDLKIREDKGMTWFDHDNGRLLHCQSDAVSDIHFGFVLTDQEQYAAVMIGHLNLNIATRKLLGQISMNLLDNNKWLQLVKSNDIAGAYGVLEDIIRSYYKSLLQ